MKLQIFRGPEGQLPELPDWALALTTDSKKLHMGSKEGNVSFLNAESVYNAIDDGDEEIKAYTDEIVQGIAHELESLRTTLNSSTIDTKSELSSAIEDTKNQIFGHINAIKLPEFNNLVTKKHLFDAVPRDLVRKPDLEGYSTKDHSHKNYLTLDQLTRIKEDTLKITGNLSNDLQAIGKTVTEKAELNHKHRMRDVLGLEDALNNSAGLPTQAGHSGEYLTTNGTVASWAAVTPTIADFSIAYTKLAKSAGGSILMTDINDGFIYAQALGPGTSLVDGYLVPITNTTFINSNTTLSGFSSVVLVNTTSGNITVTLPSAITYAGANIVVKRTTGGSNTLTINTTSSQTIDGSTSITISVQYACISMISDGSNWNII